MRYIAARLLALSVVLQLMGCVATPAPTMHKPVGPHSTYLIHLPGIAGDSPFDRWWMESLKDGGAADRVELYDWTCGHPWIEALQAYDRNHRQARKVADRIAARIRQDPHGRVIVTAESGGAGLVIWALERLPRHAMVDEVVLVAPAVSPDYDLSTALAHVRGRVLVFTSPADVFMLGMGTRLYGTIDGKHTQAAGLVGFHPPVGADGKQYAKLVELKYRSEWWIWGNFGSHGGGMSATFAQHVIAPLLVQRRTTATRPS